MRSERRLEETRRQIDAETKRSLDAGSGPRWRTCDSRPRLGSPARCSTRRTSAASSTRRSPGSTSPRWRRRRPRMAVAQRMYARALFEARGRRALEAGGGSRRSRYDARGRLELRAFLRNPQVEPAGKAKCSRRFGRRRRARSNFVRLVAEKGRAGELAEMSAELEALVAQARRTAWPSSSPRRSSSPTPRRSRSQSDREASGRASRQPVRSIPVSSADRPTDRIASRRRQRPRASRAASHELADAMTWK